MKVQVLSVITDSKKEVAMTRGGRREQELRRMTIDSDVATELARHSSVCLYVCCTFVVQ